MIRDTINNYLAAPRSMTIISILIHTIYFSFLLQQLLQSARKNLSSTNAFLYGGDWSSFPLLHLVWDSITYVKNDIYTRTRYFKEQLKQEL